jgi:acyl-coenzyme A thioesterase PaaI-like protein
MSQTDLSNPRRVNPVVDHGCFGCGDRNAIGLKLAFFRTNEGVIAEFTPRTEHEGYTRMTHGGIVSTVLDEAMSWAVIDSGRLAVTARMSVDFRKPIPSREPLVVTAQVTRDRGRAVETAAELRSVDGVMLASSTGLFVRVSEQQQQEWEATYLLGGQDS